MIETPTHLKGKNNPPPIWATVTAFILLAGLLIVLGWSLLHTQQAPVKVGDVIKPFQVTAFSGQTIDTSAAGMHGKVILVNFWASWCTPCDSEAAALQSAWADLEPTGKVQFIGVDYVDTEPEAKASIIKNGIAYPNGPDLGTRISQYFRIQGVPETYIVDQNGKLVYIQIGPFESAKQIESIIQPLIK